MNQTNPKTPSFDITYYHSEIGIIELTGIEGVLTSLYFREEIPSHSNLSNTPDYLKEVIQQLEEYFQGKRKEFSIPFKISGTIFQQNMYKKLLHIPYGTIATYSDISLQLTGDIKSVRAVGNANGKNPLSIIIPCHRVLGKSGSLVKYGGDLWRKKWLIEHEGKYIQF